MNRYIHDIQVCKNKMSRKVFLWFLTFFHSNFYQMVYQFESIKNMFKVALLNKPTER